MVVVGTGDGAVDIVQVVLISSWRLGLMIVLTVRLINVFIIGRLIINYEARTWPCRRAVTGSISQLTRWQWVVASFCFGWMNQSVKSDKL